MNKNKFYLILLLFIFLSLLNSLKAQMMESTKFSSPDCLILQISPFEAGGTMEISGKMAPRIKALIFLPGEIDGTTLSCPLSYFQRKCSIPERYILNDSGKKVKLSRIDKVDKVIITKKDAKGEQAIKLPYEVSRSLFKYFQFDINNNIIKYRGFDCLALQSLLKNVIFYPPSPSWKYEKKAPKIGSTIALATSQNLPSSIKHWALYLGQDIYLSKFGRSGEGTDSDIEIMSLESMMSLYSCDLSYTCTPMVDCPHWNGFIPGVYQ